MGEFVSTDPIIALCNELLGKLNNSRAVRDYKDGIADACEECLASDFTAMLTEIHDPDKLCKYLFTTKPCPVQMRNYDTSDLVLGSNVLSVVLWGVRGIPKAFTITKHVDTYTDCSTRYQCVATEVMPNDINSVTYILDPAGKLKGIEVTKHDLLYEVSISPAEWMHVAFKKTCLVYPYAEV